MDEQRKNEIPISSLEEFIKAINENCIDKGGLFLESMDDVWFRGESKIYPKVIPSLFRDDFNENIPKGISVTKESDLIEMAFQSFPEVFSKCNNAIERLVTMQHYTLPTRLLDVTKNSLVALFFACFGNEGEDGRVLFTKHNKSEEKDLNIVATIIEYWGNNNSISIDGIYEFLKSKDLVNQNENDFKSYVTNIVTSPLFYLPKYNNQRIVNQRGAVICAPLFEFDEEVKLFHKKAEDLSGFFDEKYFKIIGDSKKTILRELDNYGINEAVIFPEPEHQMQYIKNYFTPTEKWKLDVWP